jgi:hypothetical protein
MIRARIIIPLFVTFAILPSACAPGVQSTLLPDSTLAPGSNISQQGTITPGTFTHTLEPVTSTPVPGVATTPSSSSGLKPPDSETPAAVVTAPPPIVEYNNSVVGYKLNLPGDWSIDENGMTDGLNKEVTFSPQNPEPFIAYLSVSLDFRALDQIIDLYAQSAPDATREDVVFNGYPGIEYTYTYQNNIHRIEYFIPYGGRIILIATDRPNDGIVQSILMTIRFTAPPQPVTYDATMADNGKTFVMNIGDKLRLNLDLGYVWSAISISNPAVLAGAADGYFAFTSGTATLTTTGDPACLNSTPPCLAPSIMFTITVIVQ